MPQYPMSFNYPGPFNLTGTPGQVYSMVADAAGNLVIEAGAGPDSVDLTTDVTGILPVANGGTGAANLDALAKSGVNSDITSLAGLTTPLSAHQGGTGASLFSSGTATFVSAASVDVTDATITPESLIIVSQQGNGSALVETFDVELSPSEGFTIYSSNVASAAIVSYMRIN